MFLFRNQYRMAAGLLMLLLLFSPLARAQSLTVVAVKQQIKIVDDKLQPVLTVAPGMWGPHWQYQGIFGDYQAKGNRYVGSFGSKVRGTNVPFDCDVIVTVENKHQLHIRASFKSDQGSDITLAMLSVTVGKQLYGDNRLQVTEQGKTKNVNLPLGRGTLAHAVSKLCFKDAQNRDYVIRFASPVKIEMDKQARLVLAKGQFEPGKTYALDMTLQLPQDAQFALSPEDVKFPANWKDWFVWNATSDLSKPSVFDMSDWTDGPAGQFGRVTRKDEQLLYNGKPLKLWGINTCFSSCFPKHKVSDQQARFYARYGINSVRFHKYADGSTWNGLCSPDSYVQFQPDRCEKMDYLVNQYKQQGIFIELSANFGHARLFKNDLARVPYWKELGRLNRGVLDPGGGAIYLSQELQDIQIQQCTNFLKRTNPYTKMTYAQDPVVLAVELINEDSALFYGTMGALKRSATLRQRAGEAFGKWLRKRYGSAQALQKAWGPVLNCFKQEKLTGENWDGLIFPGGNPWYYAAQQLDGMMKQRKRRLLDTMRFLYEQQNAFYDRFAKAIRDTGYNGMIVTSNWQAGNAFSHYYNLYSDARYDIVDRHNYFGGVGTMVSRPGSGCLSSGMQQVAANPFMLSEWITTFPNPSGVEGPAIIGTYGMGLNGWDVSYMFQNGDNGKFNRYLGRNQWDVVAPQIIGIFPAIARQVRRGDVTESDLVFKRNVNLASLDKAKLGFDDKVEQGYDVKEFSSKTVPAQTLAIGRSVVNFTDQFEPTDTVDISPYIKDGKVLSATGQLAWKAGTFAQDGYITVNTPATKAVVGFAEDQPQQLDSVRITSQTPFAAIYLTALDRDQTIPTGKRLLITAIARVYNTDMKYLAGELIQKGKAPMRAETVKAQIQLGRGGGKVHVLDQDGVDTGRTRPMINGQVQIDTARDKTFYYLVEF